VTTRLQVSKACIHWPGKIAHFGWEAGRWWLCHVPWVELSCSIRNVSSHPQLLEVLETASRSLQEAYGDNAEADRFHTKAVRAVVGSDEVGGSAFGSLVLHSSAPIAAHRYNRRFVWASCLCSPGWGF
jgi:hypothetical protein